MNFDEFKSSLSASAPSVQLSQPLQALWHAGKGNWEAAHTIAQEIHSETGSWIHAYLHRQEGDYGNASYWYHRAHKPVPKSSIEEEWEQITKALLSL
jgi:hypothetical protein